MIDDSTNPDCDHALHRDHHADHVRVPLDPSIHKREYGTSMPYSDAAATAKLMRGYVTGSTGLTSPIPPSIQPTLTSSQHLCHHEAQPSSWLIQRGD